MYNKNNIFYSNIETEKQIGSKIYVYVLAVSYLSLTSRDLKYYSERCQ